MSIDYSQAAESYLRGYCVEFCKTRAQWGLFSNMAAGFPLRFCGRVHPASESLYQALRFADHNRCLALVVGQLPAGAAKVRAYESLADTRPDWDEVRQDAMRLVLWLKAEQHAALRKTLLSTGSADIVELSTHHDAFWGTVPATGGRLLVGSNVLGHLLMEVRELLRDGQKSCPEELSKMFRF